MRWTVGARQNRAKKRRKQINNALKAAGIPASEVEAFRSRLSSALAKHKLAIRPMNTEAERSAQRNRGPWRGNVSGEYHV